MKKQCSTIFTFVIVLPILFLEGCFQKEPLNPTPLAITSTNETSSTFRPVSDVPIPKDAELDRERSLILSGKQEWTGRLVMTSSISAYKAFAFFKGEMPRFNWSPIMTVQSSVSVLTFNRPNRAATVQVESRALGGSLITITVARAQGKDTVIDSPPISNRAPMQNRNRQN